MPPVFGPVSSSPTRLKSCAGARAIGPLAVADREQARPPRPRAAPRARGRRRASAAARRPASSSSCVRQTKTPLPAARPSTLTTHGGRATASAGAVGTPAASSTSLANAFEPSIRAAARVGPNTATPAVGGACRRSRRRAAPPARRRPGRSRARDRARAAPRRPRPARDGTAPSARDAGIARRRVQLVEPGLCRELPRQRVLAAARPDDQHLHGGECTGATGAVRLASPPIPSRA